MIPKHVVSVPAALTALIACAAAFTPSASVETSSAVSAIPSDYKIQPGTLALASKIIHEVEGIAEAAEEAVKDGKKLLGNYVPELPKPKIERRSPKNKKPPTKPPPSTPKSKPTPSATPQKPASSSTPAPVSSKVTPVSSTPSSTTPSSVASSSVVSSKSSVVSSTPISSSQTSSSATTSGSVSSSTPSTGTVSSTLSSTVSSTISSATSKGTPGVGRPLCGEQGSACSETSCPVKQSPKSKSKRARAALGGSLKALSVKARSLVPRYDESPDLSNYILEGLAEEKTLNWNAVARFPREFAKEPYDSAGGKQSTGYIYKYEDVLKNLRLTKLGTVTNEVKEKIEKDAEDQDGFNIVNGPLTGCTSVYIMSDQAVFAAHYWENLAFDDEDKTVEVNNENFETQVENALKNGRKVGSTIVHDKLGDNKNLFGNAHAVIMSPSKNAAEKTQFLYKNRLDTIETTLKGLLPGLTVEYHTYQPTDPGFEKVEEMTINGKTVKGTKKVNPDKKMEKKGYVYYYKQLKHDADDSGDGFTVFQYQKAQGMRIIQEHSKVWEKALPKGEAEEGEATTSA